MNRIKSNLQYPLTLLTIWLSATAFYGCSSSAGNSAENAAPAPPAATEVIALQKGKLSSTFKVPGELISFQQVDLYARENSFVNRVYVDVGSEVKAGQLLTSLEAPEITSRLTAAESRWKSQEAVYEASKANYGRLLETSKTPGTISPNDLDQARAKMNSDLAQLEASKASYKEIANTRAYLEIRAPFNGMITSRNVNPGAYVGPGGKGSERPLFTLQEQKHLRLVVSVPEAYTSYLSYGDTVNFSVKALPNEFFKAKVVRLAGALDTRLRSERVEMDVQNDNRRILPGMIAEVTIPLKSQDSTFVVPKSVIVNSSERVFVIKVENNKAVWVDVRIGRSVDGKTEIYGDLSVNDKLVKTASEEVRNDSPLANIKLSEEKTTEKH